ncbi:MAG: hypothetical protein HY248_01790, partial [Fimbriimonas ginsengisoli]|nr:hypothetical protein [Fimbriimonas ginsengisoli]
TVPGKVIFAARDEVCKSNLSQAREAVKIARMGAPDGKAPDTLEELHLGSSFTKCPIEPHEPYNYNPATGEVTCPHPGHGDY